MRSWNHAVAILGLSLAAGLTGCHGSCCQRSWCQNECEPCSSCNTCNPCNDCNAGYGAPSYQSMPAYPVYDPPATPPTQTVQPSPDSIPPTPSLPSASYTPQPVAPPSAAPQSGGYYYQPIPARQPNVFERVGSSMKRTFQRLTRRQPVSGEMIYVTGYHSPSSLVGQQSLQATSTYQQVGFHGQSVATASPRHQPTRVVENEPEPNSRPLISPPSTRTRPGSTRRY